MNSSKLPVWVERGRMKWRQEIPSQQWCNGSFEVQGRLDESHSLGMNSSERNNTGFLFHTMKSGGVRGQNRKWLGCRWRLGLYRTATSKIQISHWNVSTALMTLKWGSSDIFAEYCTVDLFHFNIHLKLLMFLMLWMVCLHHYFLETQQKKQANIHNYDKLTNTTNADFASLSSTLQLVYKYH